MRGLKTEKLFLLIEPDSRRRLVAIEALERKFPYEVFKFRFITVANCGEFRTKLARHHSFDGVIGGGEPDESGNGNLDVLEYIKRENQNIPFVIASVAPREAVDAALRANGSFHNHNSPTAPDHIVIRKAGAPPFSEVFEAVRFLDSLSPAAAVRPGAPIGLQASKRDPA